MHCITLFCGSVCAKTTLIMANIKRTDIEIAIESFRHYINCYNRLILKMMSENNVKMKVGMGWDANRDQCYALLCN